MTLSIAGAVMLALCTYCIPIGVGGGHAVQAPSPSGPISSPAETDIDSGQEDSKRASDEVSKQVAEIAETQLDAFDGPHVLESDDPHALDTTETQLDEFDELGNQSAGIVEFHKCENAETQPADCFGDFPDTQHADSFPDSQPQ